MKVYMPEGPNTGWGVCGTNLVKELAKLPPIEDVALHAIRGIDMMPIEPSKRAKINIGYTFFESNLIVGDGLKNVAQKWGEWDWIVAGSSWCEQALRRAGWERTSTIIQGVDHRIFKPVGPPVSTDNFIVFSGGKFEYRKGQDIVIAAMKVMMERHKDVALSAAWSNPWLETMKSMEQSRLVEYVHGSNDSESIGRTIIRAGLPTERVLFSWNYHNLSMPGLYRTSDVGLFPNRCEGGTNLVLMEYVACGKPAIATDATGHCDVLNSCNHVRIRPDYMRPVMVYDSGDNPIAIWQEPELEAVIERLEWAYQNRDKIREIGHRAAESMKPHTWEAAARRFHDLALRLATDKEEFAGAVANESH